MDKLIRERLELLLSFNKNNCTSICNRCIPCKLLINEIKMKKILSISTRNRVDCVQLFESRRPYLMDIDYILNTLCTHLVQIKGAEC